MIIDPVKAMLDSGYLVQEGLDGTPEYYAHLICDRGAMRIAELHRVLSRGHRSPAGIKASKKNVVRAMVKIAKDVVNGIFTLTFSEL